MSPIKFNGRAGEYFQIWLTNLFLTIITIGIYSAWAKVRRNVYFLNKTEIDGHNFGYHATGWQIFKGRLIAILVIILYVVITNFVPPASILIIIFPFVIPWIINRSMKFSARVTSYRNIRLNWNGTYGQTFLKFILAPILSIVSLGLLHPWVTKIYLNYYAKGHSYGTSSFVTNASAKEFYRGAIRSGYLPCLIAMFAAALILAILVGKYFYFEVVLDGTTELTSFANYLSDGGFGALAALLTLGFTFLIPVLVLTLMAYRILARNILINSLSLSATDDTLVVKFNSALNPFIYAWILVSNTFVTIITFGFMLPWAQVRLYKYLCASTKTEVSGDANKFIDTQKSKISSFGEEYAELEGIEVGV